MAPLRAEKNRILRYVSLALGEDSRQDVPLDLSYPPLERELPGYLSTIESLELHLNIPVDRSKVLAGKRLTVDLYLPGRDLYVELDRAGHDFTEARALTLHYYPPGLPRGFLVTHYRNLVRTLEEATGSSTGRMNAGRALVDFAKDLYVEGELGKTLVRLPKPELTWLLDRSPDEAKLQRLRDYLSSLADQLSLPSLDPRS